MERPVTRLGGLPVPYLTTVPLEFAAHVARRGLPRNLRCRRPAVRILQSDHIV
jgi:hypothetical protein